MMKRLCAVLLILPCVLLMACEVTDSGNPPGGLIQIPPTEGETPPAQDETPPAEGETPPTEGETPPAEDETPPAQGETPPAEDETPPAEDETPPTEDETPPAEEQPTQTLILLSITSPIKRGSMATLEVRGTPGVEYDISVRYSSGESSAQGLENKVADVEGKVSWSWRVGGGTKAGTYTVRVVGGGEELEVSLTVTE